MPLLKQTEIQLRRPVILKEKCTLKQAAQAMASNGVGSVLVANRAGRVVGIITDRDLAFRLSIDGLDPGEHLFLALRGPLVSATEDASVDEIIGLMKKYGVRRIPIFTSERERCIGIVTFD